MRRELNSEEVNFLYTKIGEAIWHLQHIENNLGMLILMKGIAKELNSLTESEAAAHHKRLNKLPLGRLIGEVEKLELIKMPFLDRIKEFNEQRKWIVHNSVTESGHELYTDNGRNFVFDKILGFIDEATAINRAIGEDLMEYSINKGQSREEIESNAINCLNQLKGNA